MENYFVTFDQSVALKEIGFDEPCFGYFHLDNGTTYKPYRTFNLGNHNMSNFCISRPLIGQVFKWLRDKYDLHRVIHQFDFKKDTDEEYLAEVNFTDDGFSYFRTYEEAEFFCIDKLIEIVKNKKS